MIKTLVGSIAIALMAVLPSPATAAGEDLTVSTVHSTSCDNRAPVVRFNLSRPAERIGYAPAKSDDVRWLATDVAAGRHRYTLARQPFGSTRNWVPVAAFKGDQGLYTAPVLTFARPARSKCVVTRNLRITSYDRSVNQRCPRGTDKQFQLPVRVAKGSAGYFAGKGIAEIVLRNDRQLNANGYVVPPNQREDDFFIDAPSRRATVKQTPRENSVTVTLSSQNVEVTLGELTASCQEK